MRFTEQYSYGDFIVTIANVPIVIALAWSIILYSCFLISDQIPNRVGSSSVGAFFGLHIDVIMDVIAIRIGFWNWHGKNWDYFGIPYGNFMAWYVVIFSFLFSLKSVNKGPDHRYFIKDYTTVIFVSLSMVVLNNFIILSLRQIHDILFFGYTFLVIGSSVGYLVYNKVSLVITREKHEVYLMLAIFHGFFLLVGLIEGIYFSLLSILAINLLLITLFQHPELITNRELSLHRLKLYLPVYMVILFILIKLIIHIPDYV